LKRAFEVVKQAAVKGQAAQKRAASVKAPASGKAFNEARLST
jgi:hypothetical protein